MKKLLLGVTVILLTACSTNQTNTTNQETTTQTTQKQVVKEERRYGKKGENNEKEQVTLTATDGMLNVLKMEVITPYPEEIKTENDKKSFIKILNNAKEQKGSPLNQLVDLNNISGMTFDILFNDNDYTVLVAFDFPNLDIETLLSLSEDNSIAEFVDMISKNKDNLSIDMFEREIINDGYQHVDSKSY